MSRCSAWCDVISSAVTRRLSMSRDPMKTDLRRCLGRGDLVLMGIGYMVGVGIFVLPGELVRFRSGAAASIAYVIAGLSCMLSAMNYTELGTLIPLTGSTYTYLYVIAGEVWAFLVGWLNILQYLIMIGVTSKSMSATLDSTLNGTIGRAIMEHVGSFHGSALGLYPDFIALLVPAFVSIFVVTGARITSSFNTVVTSLKLVTIAIVIGVALSFADVSNWGKDAGGFAPFGVTGVLSGSSVAVFAYVGYDGIVAASEETRDPKRDLPVGLLVSMTLVMVIYVLTVLALSLMLPYYEVDAASPYTTAFADRGLGWAVYVVSIGSIFGLSTVMLGGIFALPRVMLAMSRDGLLPEVFSRLGSRTQTPVVSVILAAVVGGVLGFLFNMSHLVNVQSLVVLTSSTSVAVAVLLLRYDSSTALSAGVTTQHPPGEQSELINGHDKPNYETTDGQGRDPISKTSKCSSVIRQTKTNIILLLVVMTMCMLTFGLTLCFGTSVITWWTVTLLVLSSIGILVTVVMFGSYVNIGNTNSFQVPFVPVTPCFSLFINIVLILMLPGITWVFLLCWLIIGLLVYVAYSMRHSHQGNTENYDQMTPDSPNLEEK